MLHLTLATCLCVLTAQSSSGHPRQTRVLTFKQVKMTWSPTQEVEIRVYTQTKRYNSHVRAENNRIMRKEKKKRREESEERKTDEK